jgi:hypothetical protein
MTYRTISVRASCRPAEGKSKVIEEAYRQPRLFPDAPAKAVQEQLI